MNTDSLASVALGALGLYALVAMLGRSLWQRWRTGSSGWRGVHGSPFLAEWWAGVLMGVAMLGLVVAPVAVAMAPGTSVSMVRVALGVLLFVAGFGLTLVAQISMGDSWRIGVQKGESTELCTAGLFRWSRNPIFTGMLLAGLGLVAWVPWAAVGWVSLWLGLELQVRVVEEPHLVAMHGSRYVAYARRTGRFWPGLGHGLPARLGSGGVR